MDPVSLTASIIAILELTTKLTSYMNSVRNATLEQKQLAVEASSLLSLLTSLRYRVEDARSSDPWFNQVRLLGVERGPLDQFRECLEKMVEQTLRTNRKDQIRSVLTWKLAKPQVQNSLERLERLKTLVNCALTSDLTTLSRAIQEEVASTRAAVATLELGMEKLYIGAQQLQTHVDQEWQDRLVRWLRIPDHSTNFQSALRKRHSRTGLWLVDGLQFNNWKRSTAPLLWLRGSPGCGKTVLSAIAVQNLLEQQYSHSDTAVIYFYFDFDDIEKQSTAKAVRSLLFQLIQQQPNGFQRLQEMYQKCESGQQRPSESAIRSLFQEIVSQTKSTYIVLDAPDECADSVEFLSFIRGLNARPTAGLHILITSRWTKDIEELLKPIKQHSIDIQSKIVDEDIELYLRDRLVTDSRLKKWPVEVRNEISNVMMSKANGMFRWVYCQLESLRQCVKVRQLRETLSTLPRTLDETYQRILQDVEARGQLRDAITVLRWLCHALTPVSLLQVVEVLAIDNGEDGGFSPAERLPDPDDVMFICSSMITCVAVDSDDNNVDILDLSEDDTDEHSGIHQPRLRKDGDDSSSFASASSSYAKQYHKVQVRLAHFSVKQYLLSDRCAFRSQFTDQQQIVESCLHYVLFLSEHVPLTKQFVRQHPLAWYAANRWWQHMQDLSGPSNNTILSLVAKLFVDKSDALWTWIQLFAPNLSNSRPNLLLERADLGHPLSYAVMTGLSDAVMTVLQTPVDTDALSSALLAASTMDYADITRILLEAIANIDPLSGHFGPALQAASLKGHSEIVKLLLARGTAVDARGGMYGSTPLQFASINGHLEVVRALLDAGADVDAQDAYYGTALQAASANGHLDVARLLIDRGANVDVHGGDFITALQAACWDGNLEIAQMLLDKGADVNALRGRFGTALYAASYEGNSQVLQFLLDRGADVNIKGGKHGSALQVASYRGHSETVRLLLDKGADVDIQGGKYGTALQAASYWERLDIVRILLDRGANVHIQGGKHGNALQAAFAVVNMRIVQMLLDAGASLFNAESR